MQQQVQNVVTSQNVLIVLEHQEKIKTSFVIILITFRMSHRRCKMYSGHGRLCVCLSVSYRIPMLLHEPGCNLGQWAPLVVHCLANLHSVHKFRCYDNIASNAKCQRMLVLARAWLIWLTLLVLIVHGVLIS